jgi:cytochrome c-type biogenesis protein
LTPTVWIAFAAGILSFLSPCILPLIPAYLAVLTGEEETGRRRGLAIRRALLFVLGFSLVFILLGLVSSLMGRFLLSHQRLIERIGGVIVIIFGLYQVGLLRLLPLYRERRLRMPKGGSAWSAWLIGMVFAFGWTPCVGPILASILTLAATGGRAWEGGLLLAFYSAGLGLPFLAAALGYRALLRLQALKKLSRYFELAGGILLILMGILLASGRFYLLINWLT